MSNFYNPSVFNNQPPMQQQAYNPMNSQSQPSQQQQQQPLAPPPPPPPTHTTASTANMRPTSTSPSISFDQYSYFNAPYGSGYGGTMNPPQPQPQTQQPVPTTQQFQSMYGTGYGVGITASSANRAPVAPPPTNYFYQDVEGGGGGGLDANSSLEQQTSYVSSQQYAMSSTQYGYQQQASPAQQQQQQQYQQQQYQQQQYQQQQQQQQAPPLPPQPSYGTIPQQIYAPQQYGATQGIDSQMSQLSLSNNPKMQQPISNTNITTGNISTLPRPTNPLELLYDKILPPQQVRAQPDVSGLFARQAKSQDMQAPHDFNLAQSSSAFIRCTTQCMPATPSLAQKWHLPLGAVIHPFSEAEKVPLVAMGAAGIVRCTKCRTYINPFSIFVEYGKKWQCNLCKHVNDVPSSYYCPLDDNGVRRDYFRRPELLHGSVEFIAPQEYMSRVPQPPAYLFLLDVSYNAIQTGIFRAAASAILNVLDQFPARTHVGFITFDSSIHFYNLKSTLTVPQMLVVGELEESLLPLPSDLLVNLHDSKIVVKALLERFSAPDGMFSNTTNVESALGAALNAAGRILGRIGGKLSVFLANLPTLGPNALSNREDRSVYGTDAEIALLNPVDNRFKEFALLYCRDQISVDIYAMVEQQNGSQYLDLASLSCLSKFTGGMTQYYSRDACLKLKSDVMRALTCETAFEAVMRIRASAGLKITSFYGNLFIRGHDLLALPNVDADKSFGIEIQHSGNFISNNACIQVAVLYTSSSGQRRIRVHNLMLPITNELSDMYRLADLDATMNLMAKIAVDNVPRKGLPFTKNDIRDRVVRCITTYKQVMRQGVGTGFNQLVLPDSLRLLPLYACALTKQDALMGGQEIRADERIYAFNLITTGNCTRTNILIHPLAFAINEIEQDLQQEETDTGSIDLGKLRLHPLSRKLVNTETACILLCDACAIYLWLAKQPLADTNLTSDISRTVKQLNKIHTSEEEEEEEEFTPTTLLARNMSVLVRNLRQVLNGSELPLRFVNEDSNQWQRVFVRKLIEDKTVPGTMSYEELLVHVHNSMK